MIDSHHYVPVLRWKRAERAALASLRYQDRAGMTPLIEIPPWGFEADNPEAGSNLQVQLPKIAEGLLKHWGHGLILVDLCHLSPHVRTTLGHHPIDVLFEAGRLNKVALVPVTGLDRVQTYQQAVRQALAVDTFGVCLRIGRKDMERMSLASDLENLLDVLNIVPGQADLVVDLGLATVGGPSIAYAAGRMPHLHEWRSFTVVAGAFPKDLTGMSVGQHLINRTEWANWTSTLKSTDKTQFRMPTFGDYGTQHHIFSEPIPGMNVSASIRYTTTDHWLVMRGEGLKNKNGPQYAQYAANAQLLIERKEFCSPDFSEGDAYIWRAASGANGGPGNPETWLRAGLTHHLTFAVRQIGQAVDLAPMGR